MGTIPGTIPKTTNDLASIKLNAKLRINPKIFSYRFILIGDVRPDEKYSETSTTNPIFKELLESITLLMPRPDFVIVNGDLVWSGKEIQYQDYSNLITTWMNETGIPIFSVPGNHEFYEEGSFDSYNEIIGDFDYLFRWKNSIFITLNNNQHPGDPHSSSLEDWGDIIQYYRFEEYQLNLLREWLENAPPVKFVFTHIPSGYYPEYQGYTKYLDILSEYNVTIVWESHIHAFHRYLYNDITHVITGGGGAELHTPAVTQTPYYFSDKYHYLVVDVNKLGRIDVKVYFYREGFIPQEYDFSLVKD